MTEHINSKQQVLRLTDVTRRLGLSRSTLYDKMSPKSPRFDPSFPRPFKLGSSSIGWLEISIDQWLKSRMSMTDQSFHNFTDQEAQH